MLPYATTVAADSPVHYWRLGDSASPAADSAGSKTCAATGSPTFGATSLLATDSNGSVTFNGSNYLDCGSYSAYGASAASIEAWVKPNSVSGYDSIAGYNGFRLYLLNGKPQFDLSVNGVTKTAASSTAISTGETHHVVGVFATPNLYIYVDGVLAGTTSRSGTISTYSSFRIGSTPTPTGQEYDGTIDEVAIYTSALSASQVRTHLEAGVGEFAPPVEDDYSDAVMASSPSHYWRMGDAPGDVVAGSSSPCRALGGTDQDVAGVVPDSGDTAANFDFGGPWVDCGVHNVLGAATASIEAWVKVDSLPTTGTKIATIAGYSGFRLRLQDGKPQFEIYLGVTKVATSSTAISPGEVHHIVGVFDRPTVSLYVDGVLAGTTSRSDTISTHSTFWIGNTPSPASESFDGTIDDVAVYTSALDASGVLGHYEAGLGGIAAPQADSYSASVNADAPVGYWRFGDAPGSPVAGSGAPCRALAGVGQGVAGLPPTTTDDAANFDFGGPWVDCGAYNPNGDTTATIEAWVNVDSLPTTGTKIATIAGFNGFRLRLQDGKPQFEVYLAVTKVASATTAITPGRTHHIVGVFSRPNVYLYVDGVLAGTASRMDTISTYSTFWIGNTPSPANESFDGTIDEVAVYDTALSAARVSAHHSAGASVLAGMPLLISESRGGGSESTCSKPVQKTGDPVSLPFGEFWHRFSDFAFPGRGLPMSLDHTYSSSLAAVNGPLGYGWSISYPSMRLSQDSGTGQVTIFEENGTEITFDPDPANPGEYVATAPRCVTTLVENGDGSWTFTRTNGGRVFDFDSTGKLVALSSLVGDPTAETTLAYDGSGRLSTVTDAAGRTLTFAWTGTRIDSVTDDSAPARSVEFDYDANGDLVTWTDVGGGMWRFTYDGSHRMLTMRDPNNEGVGSPPVIANTYDGSGRVTLQTDRLGRGTSFDYTTVPGAVIVTDPEGRDELTRFSDGVPVSITQGYGTASAATTRIFYDPDVALPSAVQDPAGRWMFMTYNERGNRTLTVDPLGRESSATYNAMGQPLTTVDGEGVTTTYSYNANYNVTSVSTPLVSSSPPVAQTVGFAYADGSHPGDVTSMTDPRGKVTEFGYDADGNRNSVTDPLGNETTTTYTYQGWVSSVVSPRGNAPGGTPADHRTEYTHNAHGDVLTVTDPLNAVTTNTYDDNRNLITVENPNLNTTTYHYDDEDQLVEVERPDSTTVGTEYFDDGQIKAQIDGAVRAPSTPTTTWDAPPR